MSSTCGGVPDVWIGDERDWGGRMPETSGVSDPLFLSIPIDGLLARSSLAFLRFSSPLDERSSHRSFLISEVHWIALTSIEFHFVGTVALGLRDVPGSRIQFGPIPGQAKRRSVPSTFFPYLRPFRAMPPLPRIEGFCVFSLSLSRSLESF